MASVPCHLKYEMFFVLIQSEADLFSASETCLSLRSRQSTRFFPQKSEQRLAKFLGNLSIFRNHF